MRNASMSGATTALGGPKLTLSEEAIETHEKRETVQKTQEL
jgi:hypothetical protein